MHANDPDEGKKQRIHEFAGHAILGLSAVAISPLLATACGSVALSAILAGVTIAAAAYTFKQVYQIRQENIGNPAIKRAVTFSYISVTAVTVLSLTGCYLAASNRSQ